MKSCTFRYSQSLFCLLAASYCQLSFAATSDELKTPDAENSNPGVNSAVNSPLDLTRGGLYYTRYMQSNGSNSNSALLLWSPSYSLGNTANDGFTLIADLGGALLNTREEMFVALQFSARAAYHLDSNYSIDLSAGIQDWTKVGSVYAMAGLGLSRRLDFSALDFTKPMHSSLRAAVQYIANSEFPTWQALLGLEVYFEPTPKPIVAAPVAPQPEPVREPVIVEKSPETAADPFAQISAEGLKLTLSSKRLAFATAKASIDTEAERYLQTIGRAFVQLNSNWTSLKIAGHTDSSGDPKRNERLSLRRAETIANVFKKAGITVTKLKVRGAGSSEPVGSNETPEGMGQNRRVEILIEADPKNAAELAEKFNEIDKAFTK